MSIADKYRPHYTYNDYCQWEGRWELVEGMPYAMEPAPGIPHQALNVRLWKTFDLSLERCRVTGCSLHIPIDWKIDDDTVVQPDLSLVCGPVRDKFLDVTPALVVEILSRSTASRDRKLKFELYEQEKVKYYLIADPRLKEIEIFELIDDKYVSVAASPQSYDFVLPDGRHLPVDFSLIWDY